MAPNIVFITFYDTICLGIRLLSSIAEANGVKSHILFVKNETYSPIFTKKESYKTYQFHYSGIVWGSCFAVDPVNQSEIELLIDKLAKLSPDLVCLSTRTFAIEICRKIFPEIKKKLPDVNILAGGWGPSLEPETFLEFTDYVCFGEGEVTIEYICDALKNGKPLDDIPNIIYRKNNQLIKNEILKPLTKQQLDALPFPDFSNRHKWLITKNRIFEGSQFQNEKVYDIFAARGCPLNCTYCLSSKYSKIYQSLSGKYCPKYRDKNINKFFEELSIAKRKGAKYIRIKDEVFPIKKEWISVFLKRYPEEIGLPFFAYVRPEFHAPDILMRLKEVGFSSTVVGIQSGSEEIRKGIYNRKLSASRIIEFANTLKNLNINFMYHYIYLNPFEKEKHLIESLEFTNNLPYAKSFIFKLEPHPETPIKKMIEQERPVSLDPVISEWYAMLLSMALRGSILRWIHRYILNYKIFKKTPFLLLPLFTFSIIKETFGFLLRKIRFNSKSANIQ